jgi:hypothetical protein
MGIDTSIQAIKIKSGDVFLLSVTIIVTLSPGSN